MKPTACMLGRVTMFTARGGTLTLPGVLSVLASDHRNLFSHLCQRESCLMRITL